MDEDEKTPIKTAKPSGRNGNVLPLGNHPGNTGGKPGRSGRPKKVWKDFIAELREDPMVQAALEQAARDSESRNFRAALDVIVKYDPDRPSEKLEHSGSKSLLEAIVGAAQRDSR